jgi:hypothetical protein
MLLIMTQPAYARTSAGTAHHMEDSTPKDKKMPVPTQIVAIFFFALVHLSQFVTFMTLDFL